MITTEMLPSVRAQTYLETLSLKFPSLHRDEERLALIMQY